jgi:uncharacterized membrane protein
VLLPAPRQAIFIAAGLCLWLLGACSSPAPASCPNDYPMSCPDAAPSFAGQVGALIQTHCAVCHGPGQQVPTLQTYGEIKAAAPRMFTQIHACLMPPATRAPLTSDERQAILEWLVCSAPNN